MTDAARLGRLGRAAIDRHRLDLRGAKVLTEAGTGPFALTSALAGAAGAEAVFALAVGPPHGDPQRVTADARSAARILGVDPKTIRLLWRREQVPDGMDVVTNLGAVRPLDMALMERLSPHGVVSLMCEAWEVRPGDVDVPGCRSLGIPVAGVFEDFGEMSVFRSCGLLAVKLCHEAGLEVAGNRIIVISADRFGDVIAAALEASLARVTRVKSAAGLTQDLVRGADCLLTADYTTDAPVLAGSSGPGPEELAAWSEGLVVVQFAGALAPGALMAHGIRVEPPVALAPRRMARTLAHLGPRPVLELHAAGLKVGELLWRRRRDDESFGPYAGLVQEL